MRPRSIAATAALFLLLFLASLAGPNVPRARAEIRNRTTTDGTVEFSNRKPRDDARAGSGRASTGGVAASVGSGTFWSRERDDGVVEFTNLPPVGARWKVWLRTGPGKASA